MTGRYQRNNLGREVGEEIKSTCDLFGCDMGIDRGVSFCCGGPDGYQSAGNDREPFCGGFFCDAHTHFLPSKSGANLFVCGECYERQVCPDCDGAGMKEDPLMNGALFECPTCDTFGHVRHFWSERRGEMIPC